MIPWPPHTNGETEAKYDLIHSWWKKNVMIFFTEAERIQTLLLRKSLAVEVPVFLWWILRTKISHECYVRTGIFLWRYLLIKTHTSRILWDFSGKKLPQTQHYRKCRWNGLNPWEDGQIKMLLCYSEIHQQIQALYWF